MGAVLPLFDTLPTSPAARPSSRPGPGTWPLPGSWPATW